MKYHIGILLLLVLIVPVTATVPNIQTVYGCSGDTSNSLPGNGQLSVTSIPPDATIRLDNDIWMDLTTVMGCSEFMGQTQCVPRVVTNTPGRGNVTPGSHKLKLSLSGYYDDTVTVTICSQKVTYVSRNLAAIPTTAPTTQLVRGGLNLVPVTTTPVAGTTTPVSGTTTVVQAVPATTTPGTTGGPVTTAVQGSGQPVSASTPSGSSAQPDTSGSLSVTTTPAGATILIDGVMRGASPATIPGITAGNHTLLLKLDGYQDMSMPVSITAGKTQEYSTALIRNPETAAGTTGTTEVLPPLKKSPGFEFIAAFAGLGAVLCMRKKRS